MVIFGFIADLFCSYNNFIFVRIEIRRPPAESTPASGDVVLTPAHQPQILESSLGRIVIHEGGLIRNPEVFLDPGHIIRKNEKMWHVDFRGDEFDRIVIETIRNYPFYAFVNIRRVNIVPPSDM